MENKTTKCPKCKKGEIKENVSVGGYIGKRYKIVTSYCNLCNFQNSQKIKISQEDYMREKENDS